jgi:hypothetical protein
MYRFITFGAGEINYIEAGQRLLNQSKTLDIFSNHKLYTEHDLKNDNDFWTQHSSFIQTQKRGYGYWLWKPYIIKKAMAEMQDGDTLLYLDCGCELTVNKKDKLKEYLELVKKEYIIVTSSGCREDLFNKMDLIINMNMLDDIYLKADQTQAGAILFYVCEKTRSIVDEWYNLGCDYHNIDDTPSLIPNVSGFIEHRHDQSIFSLLLQKHKISRRFSLFDCIYYERNKTGKPRF